MNKASTNKKGIITAMDRKVNKPRLSLRNKKEKQEVDILTRGVLNTVFTMFHLKKPLDADPWVYKAWLMTLVTPNGHTHMTKESIKHLREYMKKYNLKDWTR